jgi:hypothetical protein
MSTLFVHRGANLDDIAMKFHLSPSRLQIINNLFPPILTDDRDLEIEDPSEMTHCQHSIFVVLTSNDIELPGTITFFPDSFTFEQRQLAVSERKLIVCINIVSVITCVMIRHPRVPELQSASDASILIVTYLVDPLDSSTLTALSFTASTAELHALEYHITHLSSARQQEIHWVKPKGAAQSAEAKQIEVAAIQQLPARFRRPVARSHAIDAESAVIDKVNLVELRKALPHRLRSHSWSLVFSIREDGTSYQTLYAATRGSAACFVIIKTMDGARLGGFFPIGLKWSAKFYGSGEAFVFNFAPNLNIYRWSRKNECFAVATQSELMIGGGGGKGAALWIDDRMLNGRSEECETFDSVPLANKKAFQIEDLEVWNLGSKGE